MWSWSVKTWDVNVMPRFSSQSMVAASASGLPRFFWISGEMCSMAAKRESLLSCLSPLRRTVPEGCVPEAVCTPASSFDEDALFALLSCLKRGGKTCVAAAHHDEVGLNGFDADEGTGGEGTEQCDGGLLHGTSGKISGLDGARAP